MENLASETVQKDEHDGGRWCSVSVLSDSLGFFSFEFADF
jgi:hypothetical protein